MSDSIFTKIINGEIPAHKVYEDDKTLAFMDVNPVLPGHVLVVPKTQADIWALPDQDYQVLMATVRKVARRIQAVLKPARTGVQIVGIDVEDHAHVHVIPFNTVKEFRGLPYQAADSELKSMAKKLRF